MLAECLILVKSIGAFGTHEPIVASLINEQGGSAVLQKRLEMSRQPGINQGPQEIVDRESFNKFLLTSRVYQRPAVICFMPRNGDLAQEQTVSMKQNFSQIATEEKPGNFLYAVVDVNADGKTDEVYHRFLRVLKLDKRQAQTPLTLILVGDRVIFPTRSGYLSAEDFRAFVASKIAR